MNKDTIQAAQNDYKLAIFRTPFSLRNSVELALRDAYAKGE